LGADQNILAAFRKRMKEAGLKSTRQRDAIASKFFELDKHISVDELLAEIRVESPHIGYATVYRTLKLLVQQGFANPRHFDDGHTRYDPQFAKDPHDHIICQRCRRIVEFESPEIVKLLNEQAAELGYTIWRRRIEIYGICRDCQGK
jgi:Fur family ferric uptake transcriptional regulator